MNKFDTWNIQRSYEGYIKRLIEKHMPNKSSGLSKERIFRNVIAATTRTIEEGKLRATYGVASIKTYLRRVIFNRCANYCRDYDPETDMKLAPERFGRERDKAKKRRERWYMDEAEILDAFKSLGMNFRKDVMHKEVFLLHLKGTKRSEIVKTTGLSTSQVKKRLEYTMQKLRRNPTAILAHAEYTQNVSRYYDWRKERPLIEIPKKSLPREIRGQAEKEDEYN